MLATDELGVDRAAPALPVAPAEQVPAERAVRQTCRAADASRWRRRGRARWRARSRLDAWRRTASAGASAATAPRAPRRSSAIDPGRSSSGHCSTSMSCGIDAHVLNGGSYALTVAPGSGQPERGSSSRSHSCSAWVAVVVTCSTIARHSGRSSISSPQTIGAMPTGIAKTTTSKSSPSRRTRVSASGQSHKCDSSGASLDAAAARRAVPRAGPTGSPAARRSAPAARRSERPAPARAWRPDADRLDARAIRSRGAAHRRGGRTRSARPAARSAW